MVGGTKLFELPLSPPTEAIGRALIEEGLKRLRAMEGAGCVVLGDPNYYTRLGFREATRLNLPGFPAEHFMALGFRGYVPAADVSFHPAFG